MNLIRNALQAVAMIYSLFYYLVAALRLLWLLFVLIGAGIPWLLLAAVAVWCTSKVLQLRHRSTSIASSVDGSASKSLASRPLDRLLVTAPHRNLQHSPAVEPKSSPANGDAHSGGLYWPVAHRGADLDAPENSLAALRMVSFIVLHSETNIRLLFYVPVPHEALPNGTVGFDNHANRRAGHSESEQHETDDQLHGWKWPE